MINIREIINFRNDYVLIKRIAMPYQTPSGLHLPSKAVELPQLGRIVHLGWLQNHEQLKRGDLILLPKHGGLLYDFAGEDFYLFRQADLLAVITTEPTLTDEEITHVAKSQIR